MEDIKNHEPVYESLQSRSDYVLMRTEAGAERNQLELRINGVEGRWKDLRKATVDRQKQLEKLMPAVISYLQIRKDFIDWLAGSEQKLADVNVKRSAPGDLNDMISQQEDLKVREYQDPPDKRNLKTLEALHIFSTVRNLTITKTSGKLGPNQYRKGAWDLQDSSEDEQKCRNTSIAATWLHKQPSK